MTESIEQAREVQAARTNQALGLFLSFFGIVVLISILFTDTGIGKFTNFLAGGIITTIGTAMIVRARRKLKKLC